MNKKINPVAFAGVQKAVVSTSDILEKYYVIKDTSYLQKNNEIAECIINCVCEFTGVEKKQIKLGKRNKNIREARQYVHYFLGANTDLSLQEIGNITNNDHSTVLHSKKVVVDNSTFDKRLKERFEYLSKEIKKSLSKKLVTIKNYS